MQLRSVQIGPLKHSFFCTAALFCVLTLFFAQPITFLHFYERTSISEIWLHLLLLPQQHCVSSPSQRAQTAACAAEKVKKIMHTPMPCMFIVSKIICLNDNYPVMDIYNTYIDRSTLWPLCTWKIMTSGSLFHLIRVSCLWRQNEAITFVSVAHPSSSAFQSGEKKNPHCHLRDEIWHLSEK